MFLHLLLLSIPILFDTSDYMVVNKPSGVGVHGEGSLLPLLNSQLSLPPPSPLHLIHRLDTPTSGLLVIGKSSEAAGKIARGFQNRERDGGGREVEFITKIYVAVTGRKPKKKMGAMRGTIKKTRLGR